MEWSLMHRINTSVKKWRFKKAHYLFTGLNPDQPVFDGIYFMETKQYFFQSQN